MSARAEAAPVLSVEGLGVSFLSDGTWRRVVQGVSFAVAPRETVAIVGESGSGKSVTALSAMRLLPEDTARVDGRILLGGRDLLRLPEEEMRRIRGNAAAMIFQEPMTSLNPVMPVGRQIAEVLTTHRGLAGAAALAEAGRLLDRVRIPDAARRLREFPHQLSGGMRQRVMIAMALACAPRLLIADEPTTALDVTIQAEILALLRALQDEEAMGLVLITHDMGVVAEVADRLLVMLEGRVVEEGEVHAVFAAPRQAYTRALLAAVPRLGSLAGQPRPARFPMVDRATGEVLAPATMPETVAADAPPVLEVQGLSARFDIRAGLLGRTVGRVHAVEDVSFSIRAGETLALVGESGCGKSTTGRCILRLVEPHSGRILVGGQDIAPLRGAALRDMRRTVQSVFQDPFASLDPRQVAGFSIAEPLLVHGVADRRVAMERAAGLLRQVGLAPEMLHRYPHEFSGGQRQRICIARALALRPALLVADEAVSALDVSIKAQIVNLMLDLQAELGLAYLFISHDMAVVERVSHRVAVMRAGEIVEIGPRDAVFGGPAHAYTQRLLAAVPVPDPAVRRARRPVETEELLSPVRAPGFVPPPRRYREVGPGHLVKLEEG
jgi:peptide/nickel transport system ATP-binding protein